MNPVRTPGHGPSGAARVRSHRHRLTAGLLRLLAPALALAVVGAWVVALLGALLWARPAQAETTPMPIADFTRWPAIDSVVISPSGKRLALRLHGPSGFLRLAVMDLDPVSEPRVVAGFGDADVHQVVWLGDDRLVYSGYKRGAEIDNGGGGWFAVQHDGSAARQLIAFVHSTRTSAQIKTRMLAYDWHIDRPLTDDSHDLLAYRVRWDVKGDFSHYELGTLNADTGVLTPLAGPVPDGLDGWLIDQRGELQVLTTRRQGRDQVHVKAAPADGQSGSGWRQVADFETHGSGSFTPWLIDADGSLLVRAWTQGYEGIFRFDTERGLLEPEPLLQVKGFDLSPRALRDTASGALMGVHLRADRPMGYWLDATLQKLQDGVDAALPGRSNLLSCGRCATSRYLVVSSSSDRAPTSYHLVDREQGKLSLLGESRPWIKPDTQGRRSLHRVTTRDGQSMPVYLTSPAGADPQAALPAVVLVHGGPWLRGTDTNWRPEAQFLASRGYRVIEPEFRGSRGYGDAWFRAGWRQWGQAMQDDLLDAVQWAGQQGTVDTSRVCIMGGSYGGYAALMGAVRDPQAYRCAISFAGVTDIQLMYDISWSDVSDDYKQHGMPKLVGDRVKDAAMLDANSPVKRAGEIKVPLLVAYGVLDRRVPMAHAKAFISAARRAGVAVDELNYPAEGHGFFHPDNETDYYQRVDAFLAKALKPGAAGAQARPASAP